MAAFKNLLSSVKKFNFLIFIIVGFGVYITFFSDYNYMKVGEYDNQIKQLKAEIKACNDSTNVYKEKVRRLKAEPQALERIMREEYLLKRDNEDVYIVNN